MRRYHWRRGRGAGKRGMQVPPSLVLRIVKKLSKNYLFVTTFSSKNAKFGSGNDFDKV